MLSTAIVIFREMLEIAMIVGVLLAATRGLAGRMPWILGGIAAGVAGAALVAFFAESIASALSGSGQEVFNAVILLAAALMIGWTLVWMKKHARELTAQLREVGNGVRSGSLPFYSLSLIVGLALLREGSEIVLFIYGMILSDQEISSIIAGCLLGAFLGTAAGVMLYYGLLRIAARHMLNVTSWLLMLLVAGLTSQAVAFLSAAGYFETLSEPVWDSSWLLEDGSVIGRVLQALVGYTSQPTSIQLLFYTGTLLLLILLSRHITRQKPTVSA
jgi:high-affinity iron transporter